jgi:hypothetical protein
VKKLVFLGAGTLAAASMAVVGASATLADPGNGVNVLDVTGQPYYKAVAILHNQGVSTGFLGAVGDDLPQAKCIVDSQKAVGSGKNAKMLLMLNCNLPPGGSTDQPSSQPAAGSAPGGAGTRPTAGAPGVVTVTPVPVG